MQGVFSRRIEVNIIYVIGHNLLANYVLTRHVFRCYNPGMGKKPMTVAEMARMGGLARAKAHSKAELRAWGKQGGRPGSFDGKAIARLRKLLEAGKGQAECATIFGVSVRTVGRVVARAKRGADQKPLENRRQAAVTRSIGNA
jgi:hypothetical protein